MNAAKALRRRPRPPPTKLARPATVVLLVVAACLVLVFEPWHGVVVLALSERHGIDAGDLPALPLIALALALARTQWRLEGGGLQSAFAIALGLLLIAGVTDPKIGSPLVPAGGGTFGGSTAQADGRSQDPVDDWTDVTLTYDGTTLRLYVDGARVSSLPASGRILQTDDPLWIGGNRPYGEYFLGAVDEVRVYNRALTPTGVRAAMATPISRRVGSSASGLVAAYPFDAGAGRTAADVSGNGNAAVIHGAKWTRSGRFGGAVRFDGPGQVLRVSASPSLNLTSAMTLAAWIRPSENQSGWRTVLARQRDAYFLMAGGGREHASQLRKLDGVRFGVLIALIFAGSIALGSGWVAFGEGRRRSFLPAVALFVAGCVADAELSPSRTLVGPTLLALWWAHTTRYRGDTASAYGLAALFAALTVLALIGSTEPPLDQFDGGTARTAALGVVLLTGGLLSAKRGRPRWGGHSPRSG